MTFGSFRVQIGFSTIRQPVSAKARPCQSIPLTSTLTLYQAKGAEMVEVRWGTIQTLSYCLCLLFGKSRTHQTGVSSSTSNVVGRYLCSVWRAHAIGYIRLYPEAPAKQGIHKPIE